MEEAYYFPTAQEWRLRYSLGSLLEDMDRSSRKFRVSFLDVTGLNPDMREYLESKGYSVFELRYGPTKAGEPWAYQGARTGNGQVVFRICWDDAERALSTPGNFLALWDD